MILLFKNLLFIILLILSPGVFSQNSKFKAGLLINANGVQLEGEDAVYWSGSNGTIWGTGGLSSGGFVKRNISDHFYASLEPKIILAINTSYNC